MPRSGSSQSINGSSGFHVDFSPPFVGAEHPSTVRLLLENRGRSTLSPAGYVAVLGVVSGYLTAGKVNALSVRAGVGTAPTYQLSRAGMTLDVLPEDAPSIVSSLASILNQPANITV